MKKLRLTALLTALIFTAANIQTSWAVSMIVPEASPKMFSRESLSGFHIPAEFGNIEEFYRPDARQKPFIVFIQDAHAILNAQENIQRLIENIQEKYGIPIVALEGGKGKLDTTLYRTFPDEKVKKRIMRGYLERGEVTGGGMAAIFSASEKEYYGMEDWGLYEENAVAYLKAAQSKEKLMTSWQDVKTSLDQKRKSVYSAKLDEFHEHMSAFYEERSNLVELLKYLSTRSFGPSGLRMTGARHSERNEESHLSILMESLATEQNTAEQESLNTSIRQMANRLKMKIPGKLNIQDEMEFHKNFQAFRTAQMAPGEYLEFLIKTAGQLGFKPKLTPAMIKCLGYQKTLSMIKGTKIFDEMERLIQDLEERLITKPEEREIAIKYRKLNLLKNLISLEATRDEIDTYRKDPQAYRGILSEHTAEGLQYCQQYYRLAMKRDHAFHQNLEKLLKKNKANAAIVLAGGFHAPGFKKILKEKGYSYATVIPKVNSLAGQEVYAGLMAGNLSYKSYLKTTFYDAFVRHSTLQLVSEWNEPDFRRNLKIWRDDTLRYLSKAGRITEAKKYTRYIDLLAATYYEKYESNLKKPSNRENILEAIEVEIDRYRDETIHNLSRTFRKQLGQVMRGWDRRVSASTMTAMGSVPLDPEASVQRSELRLIYLDEAVIKEPPGRIFTTRELTTLPETKKEEPNETARRVAQKLLQLNGREMTDNAGHRQFKLQVSPLPDSNKIVVKALPLRHVDSSRRLWTFSVQPEGRIVLYGDRETKLDQEEDLLGQILNHIANASEITEKIDLIVILQDPEVIAHLERIFSDENPGMGNLTLPEIYSKAVLHQEVLNLPDDSDFRNTSIGKILNRFGSDFRLETFPENERPVMALAVRQFNSARAFHEMRNMLTPVMNSLQILQLMFKKSPVELMGEIGAELPSLLAKIANSDFPKADESQQIMVQIINLFSTEKIESVMQRAREIIQDPSQDIQHILATIETYAMSAGWLAMEELGVQEEFEEMSIHKMIRTATGVLIGNTRVKVDLKDLDKKNILARIRPLQFARVLINIFKNAGEAAELMNEPVTITVRLRRYKEGFRVMISDDGPGMPFEGVHKINHGDLYSDKGKGRKGHGIGLLDSRASVVKNGGRFWVGSRLQTSTRRGKTTFVIYLPSISRREEERAAKRRSEARANGPESIIDLSDQNIEDHDLSSMADPGESWASYFFNTNVPAMRIRWLLAFLHPTKTLDDHAHSLFFSDDPVYSELTSNDYKKLVGDLAKRLREQQNLKSKFSRLSHQFYKRYQSLPEDLQDKYAKNFRKAAIEFVTFQSVLFNWKSSIPHGARQRREPTGRAGEVDEKLRFDWSGTKGPKWKKIRRPPRLSSKGKPKVLSPGLSVAIAKDISSKKGADIILPGRIVYGIHGLLYESRDTARPFNPFIKISLLPSNLVIKGKSYMIEPSDKDNTVVLLLGPGDTTQTRQIIQSESGKKEIVLQISIDPNGKVHIKPPTDEDIFFIQEPHAVRSEARTKSQDSFLEELKNHLIDLTDTINPDLADFNQMRINRTADRMTIEFDLRVARHRQIVTQLESARAVLGSFYGNQYEITSIIPNVESKKKFEQEVYGWEFAKKKARSEARTPVDYADVIRGVMIAGMIPPAVISAYQIIEIVQLFRKNKKTASNDKTGAKSETVAGPAGVVRSEVRQNDFSRFFQSEIILPLIQDRTIRELEVFYDPESSSLVIHVDKFTEDEDRYFAATREQAQSFFYKLGLITVNVDSALRRHVDPFKAHEGFTLFQSESSAVDQVLKTKLPLVRDETELPLTSQDGSYHLNGLPSGKGYYLIKINTLSDGPPALNPEKPIRIRREAISHTHYFELLPEFELEKNLAANFAMEGMIKTLADFGVLRVKGQPYNLDLVHQKVETGDFQDFEILDPMRLLEFIYAYGLRAMREFDETAVLSPDMSPEERELEIIQNLHQLFKFAVLHAPAVDHELLASKLEVMILYFNQHLSRLHGEESVAYRILKSFLTVGAFETKPNIFAAWFHRMSLHHFLTDLLDANLQAKRRSETRLVSNELAMEMENFMISAEFRSGIVWKGGAPKTGFEWVPDFVQQMNRFAGQLGQRGLDRELVREFSEEFFPGGETLDLDLEQIDPHFRRNYPLFSLFWDMMADHAGSHPTRLRFRRSETRESMKDEIKNLQEAGMLQPIPSLRISGAMEYKMRWFFTDFGKNAIDASPPGSKVRLEILYRPAENIISLAIEDQGKGLPVQAFIESAQIILDFLNQEIQDPEEFSLANNVKNSEYRRSGMSPEEYLEYNKQLFRKFISKPSFDNLEDVLINRDSGIPFSLKRDKNTGELIVKEGAFTTGGRGFAVSAYFARNAQDQGASFNIVYSDQRGTRLESDFPIEAQEIDGVNLLDLLAEQDESMKLIAGKTDVTIEFVQGTDGRSEVRQKPPVIAQPFSFYFRKVRLNIVNYFNTRPSKPPVWKTAEVSEKMPAYELLKELQLLHPQEFPGQIVQLPAHPGGLTVRRMTIPSVLLNGTGLPQNGLGVLVNELADTRDFDLLYNQEEQLIAIFPAATPENLKAFRQVFKDSGRAARYFDFSSYYFEIPNRFLPASDQKGLEDIQQKWWGLADKVQQNQKAIEEYRAQLGLTKLIEKYSGWREGAFIYAEVSKKDGRILEIEHFSARQFLKKYATLNPEAHQLIFPILPTVYSSSHFINSDRPYYEAIADPWFDLQAGQRVEVAFAGSGFDTWLAYLAMNRNEQGKPIQLYAYDANPFAVVNVRNLAKTAGFNVNVQISGKSTGGPFDRRLANMPYASFRTEVPVIERQRLTRLWDGESGKILDQYLRSHRENLRAGGKSLIWQSRKIDPQSGLTRVEKMVRQTLDPDEFQITVQNIDDGELLDYPSTYALFRLSRRSLEAVAVRPERSDFPSPLSDLVEPETLEVGVHASRSELRDIMTERAAQKLDEFENKFDELKNKLEKLKTDELINRLRNRDQDQDALARDVKDEFRDFAWAMDARELADGILGAGLRVLTEMATPAAEAFAAETIAISTQSLAEIKALLNNLELLRAAYLSRYGSPLVIPEQNDLLIDLDLMEGEKPETIFRNFDRVGIAYPIFGSHRKENPARKIVGQHPDRAVEIGVRDTLRQKSLQRFGISFTSTAWTISNRMPVEFSDNKADAFGFKAHGVRVESSLVPYLTENFTLEERVALLTLFSMAAPLRSELRDMPGDFSWLTGRGLQAGMTHLLELSEYARRVVKSAA
ncbi:MAG: hypothetical protein HYZ83_04215 [Candidatus Omnitrophica bacterium]|nr:hypothetical protein [Candidatus Omnitrophota bacterium]